MACYLYDVMTEYRKSYGAFRTQVGDDLDLRKPGHQQALLHWLNQWGCRHLATAHHERASASLAIWYDTYMDRLPGHNDRLVSTEDPGLDVTAELFDTMQGLDAARRASGRRRFKVSFGPTAASKTLFALRPHVFVAWDDAIRSRSGHDGSGDSYLHFLQDLRGQLGEIARLCEARSLSLEALPRALGRSSQSTAAQLLGEYHWLTLTRGVATPDPGVLERWLDWSSKD
ncbi:MAG: hypothetical protein ACYC5Q_07150 [Thermoleophilia bacterium]